MALVENTKVSNELNFGERESSYPVYQYRNLYPANGARRFVELTSAGETQATIFNIPAEQVNMGESYLEYDIEVQGQGALTYAWLHRDVFGEFDSVIYRDTGSQFLTEVRNLNLYHSVISRLDTSLEDLLYNDEVNGLSISRATANAAENKRFDNTNMNIPLHEPMTFAVSAVGANAGTFTDPAVGTISLKRKIYLKDLTGKHSFLGMAKDNLLPQETYLEIGWIGNRIGFQGTSNTDPNAGVDVLEGTITINNITLKLAVQTNQDIVKEMKQRIANGLSITIPWVRVHALTGNVGAQATYNLTLDNKQHGQKIQRLIYVPFASANPANNARHTAYDHRNIPLTAPKLLTYNTELDNRKLQRDILNIANNDDYMIHKKVLKNTTYLNKNIYGHYWVHIDTFDYPETNKNDDGSIYTDGYTLDKPTIWSVNKYSGSNAAIYNFAIVQGLKQLAINSTSFVVQ